MGAVVRQRPLIVVALWRPCFDPRNILQGSQMDQAVAITLERQIDVIGEVAVLQTQPHRAILEGFPVAPDHLELIAGGSGLQ